MIYHVAQQAAPAGDGSAARPFSTIGAAAAAAQPGDTVLIHSAASTGNGYRRPGAAVPTKRASVTGAPKGNGR